MQVLLEEKPALVAHLFARLIIFQIEVAELDQVGEIILHVGDMLSVNHGSIKYVSVACGDDTRPDGEVVNEAVTEIALARQINTDARPRNLFEKVQVGDLRQPALEPELILRPQNLDGSPAGLSGKLQTKPAVHIISKILLVAEFSETGKMKIKLSPVRHVTARQNISEAVTF